MTSIIKLEVVSGAQDDYGPPCYLLQVDEFKFLLDCGIDESLSRSLVTRMAKHVKTIDAVLLSHPDAHHLGALPCLVGKHGLSCPIYCTVPVMKMGEMFMYDLYSSREMQEEFTLFTLEDVDLAFSKVTQLKYNQTVSLKGKGAGITITPLPAGHMIGGTIWRITKDGEEEIIYAVDFNHKRERHLNGCSLESILKPSVLILDCFNANYQQSKRTQRDEELMTTIFTTLRKRGNILVAVDTAGRTLELAYMLDQLWTPESGLSAYSLAMLNSVSTHVVEFAKSQVEWMSDKVMKSFEDRRNNPFHLKNVNICQDITSFMNIRQPCVVLATQPDLEAGFSRELFIEWACRDENAIILTQRCSSLTLASQILAPTNGPMVVSVETSKKVPLQGLELEEYKLQKQKELERKRADEASRIDDEDDDDDEDEDEPVRGSEELDSTSSSKLGNVTRHDLMMARDGGKSRTGSFFKKGRTVYPMFPCPDIRVKFDDYGEFINIDDFKIIDTTLMEAEKEKENAALNDKENGKMDVDEVHEEKLPTKYVTEVRTFPVAAKVSLIDFEGKSDGESLKRIVSMIKPRRLILVRGTEEATASLATYCESVKNELQLDKLFTPKVGEVIDATTESHIYQAKLKDSLVSSLKFSHSRDGAELAWVDAEIDMEEATKPMTISQPTSGDGKSDTPAPDDNIEMMPILKTLPQNLVPGHVTIFVNELKLSHFKQILVRNKIQAEFSGGVLYCNNKVAVKRNEAGRITLEGTICDDYFVIRELLYQQYAIL